MFESGVILYFTPFYFPNGNKSKNKYFIVISTSGDDLILASLPTSQDHIPNHIQKIHGCLNDDKSQFNCYFFEKGKIVSGCGTFCFPLDTYVYGEQVDIMSYSLLNSLYKIEGIDYLKRGKLSEKEFNELKRCLVNSATVKRRIKKLL